MRATIIDGKYFAEKITKEISEKVKNLQAKNVFPCLAVILVGNNAASISYVSAKQKALKNCAISEKFFHLPESISEDELLLLIDKLNADKSVHGILVQLPLPNHIRENKIILAINPEKDADGFHPINAGKMLIGNKDECRYPLPCTPRGILELLKQNNIQTSGKNIVVVGRSNIVGKPIAVLLSQKEWNATVTLCHSGTKNLEDYTRHADILIVAVGRPNTITKDMIKKDACIIDVGVNRIPDVSKKNGFRLVGDVDFENAKKIASFITPVPGGVGPMTIAMLMQNTVELAENTLT
ncbi:MAG: bifunctional 5,10-methylene-tetrahydrofolate dehydrogenase/5,10-methylene-tetrahydrofolate cyclohydrolase [Treponema sp.]|nr:bifunctional 5,10-methylene-tetrahydrofolate dehydrogenase/5,10-methylene-tetrahydrofolate cyclohydrolase [Treponema sp.]